LPFFIFCNINEEKLLVKQSPKIVTAIYLIKTIHPIVLSTIEIPDEVDAVKPAYSIFSHA
jgi:hypothetical protein